MSNSVLYVSVNAIKNNIDFVKKNMKVGQKFCLVAKANCYGLGARRLCHELNDCVDYFAVSSPQEFYQVKRVTSKPILILSPTYSRLKNLIKAGAELTVSNFESLSAVCNAAVSGDAVCKVHIAVNTGMNRFGFKNLKDFETAVKVLKKTQNISIQGVFSHYFEANSENFAKNQYEKFLNFGISYVNLSDKNVFFHIAASDGVFHKNGFDMARVGMAAYTDRLFETVKLVSKILDFQNLDAGETAGYGAIFVAKKPTKLAAIGIGYADGIFRNIAKKGWVLVRGKKAKIVAVCMDSILIDVTDLQTKIGDEVVLFGKSEGKQIFVCDMASWCGTIGYEIITKLSSRVKRKYI